LRLPQSWTWTCTSLAAAACPIRRRSLMTRCARLSPPPIECASAGGARSARRARRPPGQPKPGASDASGSGACAPLVLDASGAHAPPLAVGSHSDGQNWPAQALPLPYVANICFKCLRRFRDIFQLFHMDVAKSRSGDVEYVASVSETCHKSLFKMFHLFQLYVAIILIWMLHMFHTYVTIVYSKCFICSSLPLQQVFSCKLQVFYLDITYIFTHMLQVYFFNISSVLDVCYI
jgi:hypothetical protein